MPHDETGSLQEDCTTPALKDLRGSILLCRLFRKSAVARKDWSLEILAERRANEARKAHAALRLATGHRHTYPQEVRP